MNSLHAEPLIRRDARLGVGLALWLTLGLTAASFAAPPLARVHSHNDYEHPRPLLDALDQGFCSVEADIYLVDGELLVAHNRKDVRAGRTLQNLYLDPLRERFRANQGHIYPGLATNAVLRQPLSATAPEVEFTLLIDIKSDSVALYPVLRRVLAGYAELLTHFTPTSTVPSAVTVILSGDRPAQLVAAEPQRLCALDGRLSDLAANPSVHLYPLISESWRPTFGRFNSTGLSEADRAKLRELVATTHAQGRRLRFWDTPDASATWRELYVEGVDLINTDNLAGLAAFLKNPPAPASKP